MSDVAKINLTINKGATFRHKFIWQDAKGRPIDLTGYSARMQVREDYASATPVLSLLSTNGGIVLGDKAGSVSLYISDTATSAIAISKGVYDIELISPSNEVFRLVGGTVVITPEVTR